jgi:hypothetical protein
MIYTFVGEAARAEQGKTVDRGVDSREVVDRAQSQRLAGLLDCCLELARPQQRPSERRSAEREVRVDLERSCELDQRLLVVPFVAQAQAKSHPGPRLRRVEGNGILCMPLSFLVAVPNTRQPAEESRPPDRPAQNGMRFGIARLDLGGALEQGASFLILPAADPVDQADGADDKTPGINAQGWLIRRSDSLLRVKVRLDRGDHILGDFILDREDVAQLAVVPLGPDVLTGHCIDELPGDANPSTRGPDAAFEDVTDGQLDTDLPNVDGSPLVGEGRVARDDEEPARRDSAVVISSVIPSAKCSCSGSPLIFVNGRTAIEGVSVPAKAARGATGCSEEGDARNDSPV